MCFHIWLKKAVLTSLCMQNIQEGRYYALCRKLIRKSGVGAKCVVAAYYILYSNTLISNFIHPLTEAWKLIVSSECDQSYMCLCVFLSACRGEGRLRPVQRSQGHCLSRGAAGRKRGRED